MDEGLEPWEQMVCGPCDVTTASPEERKLKHVPNPLKPTRKEIDEHERRGHNPFRNWCRVCNMARGKEDLHPRVDDSEDILPEVGMDYDHLGNKEDDDDKITAIVMKDERSGRLWGQPS